MRKMEYVEYEFLIRELKTLINKRFERFRKTDENFYILKIQDKEIAIDLGVRMNITKYIQKSEADWLCEKIDKELDNKKVVNVEIYKNDRIVSFEFEYGYRLIVECFAKGNIILTKDGIILIAHTEREWSTRKIKKEEVYKEPDSISTKELELSDKYIIVSMIKLQLGKAYCKYILEMLNIDEKKPGKELTKKEVESIENEIGRIKTDPHPYLLKEDQKIVDYSIIKIQENAFETPTLSEAIDEYYWNNKEEENPKLEKLKKRLMEQKEKLIEIEEQMEEYKKNGDAIYQNFQKINLVLESTKGKRMDELEKEMKVNKKEKKIEIEI